MFHIFQNAILVKRCEKQILFVKIPLAHANLALRNPSPS
jgi:hypothetical protein